MAKMNNFSMDSLKDVINSIKLNYNSEKENNLELCSKFWTETVGEKISEYSRVKNITSDNILELICSDSIVANELYNAENIILEKLNKKLEEYGIKISGMKFNYRNW